MMPVLGLRIAAAAFAIALGATGAHGSLEKYMNHEAMMNALRAVDAAESCSITTLASSGEGRDVPLLVLAADQSSAHSQPALLIVAGIDARYLLSTETAIRVARLLVEEHADVLKDMTVYVVPRLNPDAAERNLATVTNGHVVTLTPVDNDRDGAADEDGPQDINGDGAITSMRRLNPPIDDPPTHMADPNEVRLLKTPDAIKNERAVYTVYVEGLDVDNDGRIAEDGIGGVDLDKNFMHLWPEYQKDAGVTQLSEAPSLALAKFVVEHANIVMAITYGRHDNLINVPAGKAKDELNRGPRDVDGDDVPLYKEVSELFKKATGQTRAPNEEIAGSFHAWLYAHRGVPSFATVVWGRPDESKDAEEKDEGEKPEKEGARAVSEAKAAAPATTDAISGTWSGSASVPEMGDIPLTFNLTLAGDGNVTGTVESMPGTGQVTGTFHGDSLNLVASFGPEFSLSMDLKIDGESMSGSTVTPDGETANITARRTAVAATEGGETGSSEKSEKSGKKDEDKPADAEAAAWLAYDDKDRGGEGFIEWQPFDHPTLGPVEIGGFVWHFRINPPAAQLDELALKQKDFALELMTKRPKLSATGPTVEELAPGLYEIRFAVINEGLLPTKTRMATQSRATLPTIVRISTPVESMVSGERVSRVWGIAGAGGRSTHEWTVRAEPGSDITIEVLNVQGEMLTYTFKAQTNKSAEGATP